MAKKGVKENPKGFENVEETLTRTERFIEDNYRSLLYGLVIVVVIVGAVWLIRLSITGKSDDARSQMYVAEEYFANDSINLALYGDGNYLGFIDIADEYSSTKPGNIANYYAGVCYLRNGDYEDAIDYLNRFRKNDLTISPLAYGCTGDAWVELGDIQKGIDFYLKAADHSDNLFYNPLYLLKAGQLYEMDGNRDKALELYQRIKDDYPNSNEGNTIEKYIARVNF
ncbi:MAG: tetratricopeptide repeat protein [Bacteroidales bacterium]|nr:tetratricopeptide repeat protein [Bacteroidales bacterium]